MGVRGAGDNASAVLRRPPPEHPYAIPAVPGGHGLWLIRQGNAPPLGYIRTRRITGGFAFDVYAHCRDHHARRPWLHTAPTLNSATAWAVQHSQEIYELIATSTPEPEHWPPQL